MDPDLPVSAWAHLCRVHTSVARGLESELERDFGLTLTSFGVLRALAQADDNRARLNCLAVPANMTKSGISRLIDRLEASKLVRTENCPSDGRGSFAVLTDAGVNVVAEASARFCAGVREALTTSLSEEDVTALGSILERIS
jgi:DNA-binding MarR family transcriptional regulator